MDDSEVDVRSLLGAPKVEFGAEAAPADYYISGYGREIRPVTGRVLIYRRADMIFYVWIDEEGKVEHTYRGTS